VLKAKVKDGNKGQKSEKPTNLRVILRKFAMSSGVCNESTQLTIKKKKFERFSC
jgi:hypothetical protein